MAFPREKEPSGFRAKLVPPLFCEALQRALLFDFCFHLCHEEIGLRSHKSASCGPYIACRHFSLAYRALWRDSIWWSWHRLQASGLPSPLPLVVHLLSSPEAREPPGKQTGWCLKLVSKDVWSALLKGPELSFPVRPFCSPVSGPVPSQDINCPHHRWGWRGNYQQELASWSLPPSPLIYRCLFYGPPMSSPYKLLATIIYTCPKTQKDLIFPGASGLWTAACIRIIWSQIDGWLHPQSF